MGRFNGECRLGEWPQMKHPKLQQIVAYLLLFGERPHSRESLSSAMWPSSTPSRGRRNLRQCLWQIQRHPPGEGIPQVPLLRANREWVQVVRDGIWVDLARIEDAYDRVSRVAGERLLAGDAERAREAVRLYRGPLLDGWDHDWCVRERVRLESVVSTLLERLVAYSEATGRLEEAFYYAQALLGKDLANERAHWWVMRLHHRAGNRSEALRQFERCRMALAEDLGVEPGTLVQTLYDEIRTR